MAEYDTLRYYRRESSCVVVLCCGREMLRSLVLPPVPQTFRNPHGTATAGPRKPHGLWSFVP
jgi:hypothetical protein